MPGKKRMTIRERKRIAVNMKRYGKGSLGGRPKTKAA